MKLIKRMLFMVIILALFIPALACTQETSATTIPLTHEQLTDPEAVIIIYYGETWIENNNQHDFIDQITFHNWSGGVAVINIDDFDYVFSIDTEDTIYFGEDAKFSFMYNGETLLITNNSGERVVVNEISLKAS